MAGSEFRKGVVLCAIMGLFWIGSDQLQAEEPTYQGRIMSEWVGDLHNPSPQVRDKATEAFRSMGPPAVPFILELLKDPNPDVQQAAIKSLGVIVPVQKNVVLALVEMLH